MKLIHKPLIKVFHLLNWNDRLDRPAPFKEIRIIESPKPSDRQRYR
jgi:hypothetical protein